MNKKKKTICLITNWYPTEENPYQGVFFKEQAQALGDVFDFIVVHYNEKKKEPLLRYVKRALCKSEVVVEKIKEEKNIIEYNADAYYPKYKIYQDKLVSFFNRRFKNFVGRKTFELSRFSAAEKRKKELITKIFKNYFYNKIDVFYCVDAQFESYILQCAAEAIGKPYVVSEHAPFPYPGNIIPYSEKNAIENASVFMAISYDKVRQVMMQNIQPRKIAYVGNMVDEAQFTLKQEENEIKTFVMVAANSFYKNYSLFMQIFNRLTEITNIPFRVLVVGYNANKGYSKNAEELEQKIMSSKFASFVELIPEIKHERIHEVYHRADAFVMTSIQEGMPVSALEAGCCGLPIFTTMCGGVEDYINEKIGRLYKIIDIESFATGLKEYLEGRIKFDNVNIRETIVANYGKKIFINRISRVFEDAINEYENDIDK